MTARVVIVGAGIGGLTAGLMFGRQGHDVIICERDRAPVPGTPEDMWSEWERPGIPQARLGHTFLAGFRARLGDRMPDVLAQILAAGAPLVDFSLDMPRGDRRAEDIQMASIMCRRHVLEGILRQAAEAEPSVDLRAGCAVVGLTADRALSRVPPTVTGVRLRDRTGIAADTVVVAAGRLAPIGRWIEGIGGRAPEERAVPSRFLCFTRFFRINLSPGEDYAISTALTVDGCTDCMAYEIFGADRGTFCVELIPRSRDHDLRGLRHEDVHMAIARALPESEGWLDPARSVPIGPVVAMGQERNVVRGFVVDGAPVALGLHVIGDARCQTDSQYAWGCGHALAAACAGIDAFKEYRGDATAQALAVEGCIGPELEGRHAYAVARIAGLERSLCGEPEWDGTGGARELVLRTVLPAAEHDPEVFRAATRWDIQLNPVDALERNAEVIRRALELEHVRLGAGDTSPPSRETVLAAIDAHGG